MNANIESAEQKNKRYLVTTSYYILAPDDETAIKEAIAASAAKNKAEDCTSSVDEILEMPFGSKPNRRIM